jgi:hypothetical protein
MFLEQVSKCGHVSSCIKILNFEIMISSNLTLPFSNIISLKNYDLENKVPFFICLVVVMEILVSQ